MEYKIESEDFITQRTKDEVLRVFDTRLDETLLCRPGLKRVALVEDGDIKVTIEPVKV